MVNEPTPIVQDFSDIMKRIAAQEEEIPARALKDGGGDGTSDGMSDDSLKPRIDFLHTAFLWLAGGLITAVLALFGAIALSSSGTNGRIDTVTGRLSAVEATTARLDERTAAMEKRLDRMDGKLDAILDRLPTKK